MNVHKERFEKLQRELAVWDLTAQRFREGFAVYRGRKRITRQLTLKACLVWVEDYAAGRVLGW